MQPASVDLRLGDSLPRVPQPPRVGDRPARRAAGGPDRGGRGRPPRRASSSTPASSASAARRSGSSCRTTSWRGSRASRALGPARADRPRHRGLHRPGLEGHADARAQQPHAGPDQALPRAADRPAVVHGARQAGRAAVRLARSSARTTRARWRPPRAATCGSFPRRASGRAAGGRRSSGRGTLEDAVLRRRGAAGALRRACCRPSARSATRRSRPRAGVSTGADAGRARCWSRARWRPPSSPDTVSLPATMGVET